MTRRPSPFRQSDIARAIKGARAAGLVVEKVEVDAEGTIVVTSARPGAPTASSELELWRAKRARQAEGH